RLTGQPRCTPGSMRARLPGAWPSSTRGAGRRVKRGAPFGRAKKSRQLLGAEHAQRLLVAEDARHPALDEPFGAAPREKPAVEADPIDVRRFGRMKIDTGVSGRDCAVTVEADHEGAHLVGAAADHRLMALAVDE